MNSASNVSAAPQTIDHFVGAQRIKDRVRVALEATWNNGNGCVFPHTLALGAGGLGKTEISRIIAKEMGVELVEVLGQSIRTTAELNAALLQAEGGCLLVDEAASLNAEIQVALLKALQESLIFLGGHNGGRVQRMELKPFCLIAATTDEWALTQPLVDRFRLVLRFEHYGVDDMATLVARRARSAGIVLEDGVADMIAQRGKGTPRLGIRLLESCIRTMQAEATGTVSAATFERTCNLEHLDALGLDAVEQKYLQLLRESQGTLRLNVIASSLGLPRATVERSIEPYLIRAQLIQKDESGRSLTQRGWMHVGCAPSAFTKSNVVSEGGDRARST